MLQSPVSIIPSPAIALPGLWVATWVSNLTPPARNLIGDSSATWTQTHDVQRRGTICYFHLIITANRLWMVALCWYHANISAHPSLTCQEATYVCKHFLRHIISTNSKILRLNYGLFTFFTSNSWSVCPLNWRVSWHLNSYTRVAAHEIPVRGSHRLKVGGQLNARLEFCV